jgi:hypothetical protein
MNAVSAGCTSRHTWYRGPVGEGSYDSERQGRQLFLARRLTCISAPGQASWKLKHRSTRHSCTPRDVADSSLVTACQKTCILVWIVLAEPISS